MSVATHVAPARHETYALMSERQASRAPDNLAAIDWGTWKPVDRATLLFVMRDSQVLLIRKLRGLIDA